MVKSLFTYGCLHVCEVRGAQGHFNEFYYLAVEPHGLVVTAVEPLLSFLHESPSLAANFDTRILAAAAAMIMISPIVHEDVQVCPRDRNLLKCIRSTY